MRAAMIATIVTLASAQQQFGAQQAFRPMGAMGAGAPMVGQQGPRFGSNQVGSQVARGPATMPVGAAPSFGQMQQPGQGFAQMQQPGQGFAQMQQPGQGFAQMQQPGQGFPQLQQAGQGFAQMQQPGQGFAQMQQPGQVFPQKQQPGQVSQFQGSFNFPGFQGEVSKNAQGFQGLQFAGQAGQNAFQFQIPASSMQFPGVQSMMGGQQSVGFGRPALPQQAQVFGAPQGASQSGDITPGSTHTVNGVTYKRIAVDPSQVQNILAQNPGSVLASGTH